MLLNIRAIFVSIMLMLSFNAQANWFGGNNFMGSNNCPPWINDCNNWPVWTPMYWMEEFSNEMGNNNYGYNNGYNNGYGNGYTPYGYGNLPYGYVPNANTPQMPFNAPPQYQAPPMMRRPNPNVAPFNR